MPKASVRERSRPAARLGPATAQQTIRRLCCCSLLLFAFDAAAQPRPESTQTVAAQIREQNLRVLRESVVKREAVLVSPQLWSAFDASAEAAAAAANPTPPSGASPAEAIATGTTISPSTAAAPVIDPISAHTGSNLIKGQLSTVDLRPSEESIAKQQVVELLRPSLPIAATSLVTFPDLVRQLDQQSHVVNLKPYVIVGKAMTYQSGPDLFTGEVRVGVIDVADKLTQRLLSRPLWFEVSESGVATPPSLLIDTAGAPPLSFTIAERRPSVPYQVRVSSSFEQEGIVVDLKVKPTLFVHTDRGVLQGLGLEKTAVHVISYGHENPEGITITLSSPTSPHFDASTLHLDKEGRASTALRSDSPGIVSLKATAPGFDSVPFAIHFLWPLQTLVVSTSGGLLGGLIRLLPLVNGSSRPHWWRVLLTSVGIGLLVFILALVGIKLLPVHFAVQVGYVYVFAISALGAWFGNRAFRGLGSIGPNWVQGSETARSVGLVPTEGTDARSK